MEQKKKWLALFQEGKLNEEEQAQVEAWISAGEIDLEELDQFSETMDLLEAAEQRSPSPSMDSRFYAMLESQKTVSSKAWNLPGWLTMPWRLAIPVVLGLLVFWGGMQCGSNPASTQQTPPTSSQQQVASLLSTEDVSEKIHLVSSSKIEDETDKKVIEALLFTLTNDESTNVRLACIDVLMNYSYLPIVRAGLVSSINHQTSPVVLANLAEAIEASGKKLDKADFQSRINQNLPPPVRKSMEDILTQL